MESEGDVIRGRAEHRITGDTEWQRQDNEQMAIHPMRTQYDSFEGAAVHEEWRGRGVKNPCCVMLQPWRQAWNNLWKIKVQINLGEKDQVKTRLESEGRSERT